ncbi:hypothetical protein BG006_007021, partial [Podila minutissima]
DEIFTHLNEALDAFEPAERQELLKQVNGIFEFHICKEEAPTSEVKITGMIKPGPTPLNPDITLFLMDDDMIALAVGDLSGARAFITDHIGLKGPMGSESDLGYDGFESSFLTLQIYEYLQVLTDEEHKAKVAKVKGIFLFNVKNAKGNTAMWMMDMKSGISTMKKGKVEGLKPDIVLEMKDRDFVDLFMGKTNGQKAFMTGRIKVKGAIMLALKLDTMMKDTQEKIGFFGEKAKL